MNSLLIANIPYNCDENYVQNWIEARGVSVGRIQLIPDLVSRTSPSFARIQLLNADHTDRVSHLLDGQKLNTHILKVKVLNPS